MGHPDMELALTGGADGGFDGGLVGFGVADISVDGGMGNGSEQYAIVTVSL
ncbi:hypothetical protein PM082_015067 [Marasmius tenuissimus]|nr:hypothetical protein PM082_015067 [Marasmius tenuissimus]